MHMYADVYAETFDACQASLAVNLLMDAGKLYHTSIDINSND